jgi:hypothetical protein
VISRQTIVKQISEDWSEKPQSEICIAILDYLFRNNFSSLSYITYGSLRKVVGEDYQHTDLLEAIQYLCGNRTNLLEAKFEIIEDDNHIDIENFELKKAYETGQLLHPETGELIGDFKSQVSMYFQPSLLAKNLVKLNAV